MGSVPLSDGKHDPAASRHRSCEAHLSGCLPLRACWYCTRWHLIIEVKTDCKSYPHYYSLHIGVLLADLAVQVVAQHWAFHKASLLTHTRHINLISPALIHKYSFPSIGTAPSSPMCITSFWQSSATSMSASHMPWDVTLQIGGLSTVVLHVVTLCVALLLIGWSIWFAVVKCESNQCSCNLIYLMIGLQGKVSPHHCNKGPQSAWPLHSRQRQVQCLGIHSQSPFLASALGQCLFKLHKLDLSQTGKQLTCK